MNREDPEVLAHLAAENAFLAQALSAQRPLEQQLFDEIKSRVEETDMSVPTRQRGWWYFERTREGLNYPISCRVPVTGDTPPEIHPTETLPGEEVIYDENVEAGDNDFFSVGVFALSTDDAWLAVGVDTTGNERHRLTLRPLLGQAPVGDVLEDLSYGFAWASDGRHFFYTRMDETMRPFQLWRHELGQDTATDVLVYQEDDPQYNVSVGRSRDNQVILVQLDSSMTTEVHFLDAHRPTDTLQLVEARRHGIEYGLEHFVDAQGRAWWLKITNEDATDFRLLARPVAESAWREIIAHRPGTRLDGVEAFASFLAISERIEGCAAVRIAPLAAGDSPLEDLLTRSYLVEGNAWPNTVALAGNAEFDTSSVRVVMTSMVTPQLVADVDVATGSLHVLKQQKVRGGYDESKYVTGRLWVRASDGVEVPVSLVARRDLVTVGSDGALTPKAPSPFLLYAYGSYEASMDPGFSSLRLSLLDRGVIYAIAHVRGGGEMGRAWYEMGRLAQKATTFSDFVAVGRYLVDQHWTTPDRFAARGGSAGGLLMGAMMNLAPDLFKAVVADVPFVDSLTTMLDDSLPLTAGEWEEWGNPDESEVAYRIMKGYSPYDNVRATNDDGSPRVYPHLFASGGLHDSRVGFWEPTKWVLKLRDASPDNVAYLKMEMGAGHAGPSGRYNWWRDEAEVLAWLLSEISPTASAG
jgi:oligopeptidase B